jgi:pimeloyl-ACP methyl ester carboxylesterase
MVTAGYLEREVAVSDIKLRYQEWGNPSAPPIVMLHGFGVSGHMFDEFAERMQDHYRLLALDQRGHGDSEWAPDGDYTRDSFVNDLEGFRAALGLERFILVGHSMGGLNSVAYVNRYREHVRALVLVDVGPESAKEGVDNIVRFTRGPDELDFDEFVEMAHRFNQRRTIENIRERMRHRLRPLENGKWTWKFDKRFREPDSGLRIGSELTNDETWALFRGVRVPTLLVRGAESDVLTQAVAERAASEMPRATLVIVPSAGHSVPGDNPDAFTAAVREFLGDLDSGKFEAIAAKEPPPLERLMAEDAGARRRGAGLLAMVLVGVGAVLALAGAGYLVRRSATRRRRDRQTVRARASAAVQQLPLPAVDVEKARERAAEVVAHLTEVGASGMARARQTLHDVDLERARSAAHEALTLLGEGSRRAPHLVRTTADRVDRKKLRRRSRRAADSGRSAGRTALRVAVALAGMALSRRSKQTKRRRLAWRLK